MNLQGLEKTKYVIVLMLFSLLVCCTRGGGTDGQEADWEELRLARISHVDSVTIRAVLDPDTIAGAEALADLTAEAWTLIDDATGCIISQKNGHRRMFMASLTKMMTCLLALENGCLTDTVHITDDVFINRDSRVRLGDGYVMSDLIYEMMLQSDNDAAYALAKHVGGDTLSFYSLMNDKAAYLGMNDTHFANPNGMPNDSNYSTARDLVRLTRYCLSDSTYAAIVGTAERDIPLIDGRHMPIHNTNQLLDTYDGCIGVKTGFTRQAGYCLASAATRNGTTLVLVLLNSRSMKSRFTESAVILDYGFRVMADFGK